MRKPIAAKQQWVYAGMTNRSPDSPWEVLLSKLHELTRDAEGVQLK